jgi:hypothetical protein
MISNTEKLGILIRSYREDPLKFFRDVLKVTLDEQQTQLVLEATREGSRVMVKSARGTGKTFVITGLTLFFLFCFKDVNIRILSPSEQQLKNVFMREIRKHINNMDSFMVSFFEVRSMSIINKKIPLNVAHCVTASVERPENVSGVHAAKQIYILDEASAISDEIYATITGSLGTADGGGHIVGVSNPTRGSQVFYSDLFEKRPKSWKLMTFTAFKCPMISQKFIEEQRELYGEDGDEYRVSVLGEFPRADGSTFIPAALVDEAANRSLRAYEFTNFPAVMGVDIARSLSGDKSVLCVRKGPKVTDVVSFRTSDTMEVVARMSDAVGEHNIQMIYGDSTGVGGPVLDRARQLIKVPIIDVVVAQRSTDPMQYANLRTQLWGEMRNWLQTGEIPDIYELKRELKEMTWGYNGKMAMQLTSKKQLKTASPDHADALALSLYDASGTIRRVNYKPRQIRRANVLWA